MRKALRVSGLTVGEMSVFLGVTRETVGRWINGRTEPSTQTLMVWASKTGVSYRWLVSG
ncbi:helix-turn-helix domain-containing protein [Rhodococcus sp. NPDC019627]